MEPESEQKKLERLARVRDNQRKSRARKQEYVRELEQKVAACNEDARLKDVQHRIAVQALEGENRRLRQLIAYLGVHPAAVEEYVRTSDNPVANKKVAIPAAASRCDAGSSCESSSASACKTQQQQQQQQLDPCLQSEVPTGRLEQGVQLNSTRDSTNGSTSDMMSPNTRQTSISEVSGTPPMTVTPDEEICGCCNDPLDDTWPSVEAGDLNTTLCSVAGELLRQYNIKGMDVCEIREKLWAGFRKGTIPGQGCRVENQLLFQVLDEMSNL
ncbi:hypothetical protein ASPZODRAFT_131173 [Penicilliopsis zonata CBS 506.65]|uniref:BZIP domain-containing protein n=1 Tax=Penicilliopsis zonata CBS 506.65 TaxID=1073090 RepID=A0A1L9SKD7_9EURO|nr:hypothetical protein ASPZODRAFT_131173 [Penicilliopsis zonata CBS 506.65]OJJ47627.1 hypothetical protein ASPZODRAFT_131173 [Penicilliopsis zonata CBS 506.65]